MSERTLEELRLAARAGLEHMHDGGWEAIDELYERAQNAERQLRLIAARRAVRKKSRAKE